MRTETVINDTYDFAIDRRLNNLDTLMEVGFTANRRLLASNATAMTAILVRRPLVRCIGLPWRRCAG